MHLANRERGIETDTGEREMNTKTTNAADPAKSGKAAAAAKGGRKQSRLANVEAHAVSAQALEAGAGSKPPKKPFVL